ncbi:DUF937 domain-containing protein [Agrococcus carbonis]|uniref:DUF937 domain-containing protein n=1 Tax=Agrococcus carbonis TaxID=684552 RepID=A0A1H1LU84_9MICO|nr:DUF937 domain-containing protein [Agrococcus carbonis]SDR78086.1 protein of unknown function [Agrococcus carbonis]
MSEIQQLIGRMPVQQIAQQAGVDEAEARQAIEAIVPALVGGMQANAHDPAGARSLAGALGGHQGNLDARLGGDIDADDGQRIVRNIFGDNTDQIARAAGGGSALGGIIQKILPIVAPIVLAWIANKFFGQRGQEQSGQQPDGQQSDGHAAPQQPPAGGGAASPFDKGSPGAERPMHVPSPEQQSEPGEPQAQPKADDGFGLDDLLGGILGGGGGKQGGGLGPLGDVLGGLLGGGRRG